MADNDRRARGIDMYNEVLRPDKGKGHDSKDIIGIRELTLDHLMADVWNRGQLSDVVNLFVTPQLSRFFHVQ